MTPVPHPRAGAAQETEADVVAKVIARVLREHRDLPRDAREDPGQEMWLWIFANEGKASKWREGSMGYLYACLYREATRWATKETKGRDALR